MRAALGLKIGRASERGFNHIPLSAGRRVTLSLCEMPPLHMLSKLAFLIALIVQCSCGLPFLLKNGPHQAMWPLQMNGRTVFIDEHASIILEPSDACTAANFHEGLAAAHKCKGKDQSGSGFIDYAGMWQIPPTYCFECLDIFSEGVAYACDAVTSNCGFIGPDGRIVIPFNFSLGNTFDNRFSNGWAPVALKTCGYIYNERQYRKGCDYIYIDKSGQQASRRHYQVAFSYSNDLALVMFEDRFRYIDRQENIRISPEFQSLRPFSEGLAAAQNQGKWGFIDVHGNTVIPTIYERVGNFSENLAPACTPAGCGYIAPSGSVVIPFNFINAGDFAGPLAHVILRSPCKSYGYSGYINQKGTLIVCENDE